MKHSKIFTLAVAMLSLVLFSFSNGEKNSPKKVVEVMKSKVVWKGYKFTGSHEGLIDMTSGKLMFDGDKLTGGEFVIDMTSLTNSDLEGEYKGKLEGHLKSDDFFSVKTYPTAKLVFTNVEAKSKNAYTVTADLTIKGITKPVTFDASIYGKKANATLKVDRAEYNVKYGSSSFFENLADKVIYDEFDLVIDIEF